MADEQQVSGAVVAAPPKSEKGYFRFDLTEVFTIGQYTGNQVSTWKDADDLHAKVAPLAGTGEVLTFHVRASEKFPQYSPTVNKVTKADGSVLWEQPKKGGNNWQGGKKQGGGNWESPPERAAKNASIETQVAAKVVEAVAVSALANGVSPEGLDTWVDHVVSAIPKVATALRTSVEISATGQAAVDAAKALEAAAKQAAATPPATPPSAPQASSNSGSNKMGEALNGVLAKYGKPSAVKAAYVARFPDRGEKEVVAMTTDELEALLT